MSSETYIIASCRPWNRGMAARLAGRLGHQFISCTNPEELTLEYLNQVRPQRIFFPHWSWIVPNEIFSRFECVVFHMTDLPFGRGGSPLQNLIVRGITHTKMSALRMVAEVDAGPIYLKRPLALEGNAEEIFLRASKVIEDMIAEIVTHDPEPIPQQGDVVSFRRRKPHESDLKDCATATQVFDMIRMLDAEGYPHAFVDVGNLRIEFRAATLVGDEVGCRARIYVRKTS